MNSISNCFLLVCLAMTFLLKGQNSALYTTYFHNSHLQKHHINPAYFLEAPAAGSIQYQSFPGVLSRLKKFQVDFSMNINENQYMGLQVFNENEGKFIDRNRVYGLYGVKTEVSNDVYVSMGIQAGVVNHSYKGSTSSPESSANGFDLGLGVCLHSAKVDVGVAMFQVPKAEITPINTTYILPRVLEAFGAISIDLTEKLVFIPFARVRHVQTINRTVYQVSPNFLLNDGSLGAGVNFIKDQGLSPHVDITLPIEEKVRVKIGASYFTPLFMNTTQDLPLNKYELSLIHI